MHFRLNRLIISAVFALIVFGGLILPLGWAATARASAPSLLVHKSTQSSPFALRPSDTISVFLPMAMNPTKPNRGIYGTVYENGVPVGGVKVGLRVFTTTEIGNTIFGGDNSEISTTNTLVNGSYSFLNAPLVSDEGNQRHYYAVSYSNPSITDNGRLQGWLTRWLYTNSYTTTEEYHIGDFDIGDVQLISPISSTVVTLPYTFQYKLRNTPLDGSYSIFFSDNHTFGKFFLLDASNTFTLTTGMLPSNVQSGQNMNWSISIFQSNSISGPGHYNFTASGHSFGVSISITNP